MPGDFGRTDMKPFRTLAFTFAGLLLACSSWSAHAAAAVAFADNGKNFIAFNENDLERAKVKALQGCRARGNNCKIMGATNNAGAIAFADAPAGAAFAIRKDPGAARDAVLAECRKLYQGCKFDALFWERGGTWVAWATAVDSNGAMVFEHFAHRHLTEAAAREEALARCEAGIKGRPDASCKLDAAWGKWTHAIARSGKHVGAGVVRDRQLAEADALRACRMAAGQGESCRIERVTENLGPTDEPASFVRIAAQTVMEKEKALIASRQRQSAKIQKTVLSCTNRCVNGSCVRSFPDGRTERWEAPREFDPFTQEWKWNTSSCGG